jgi:hypothetical protein
MTDAQTALLLAHIWIAGLSGPRYKLAMGLLFLSFYSYFAYFQ